MFRDLLSELPRPNYDTLKYLLRHLLRVTEHSDKNRMHIQNLAIVFGPTLLSSGEEPRNLALDMMQQNQVIEFLLLEFNFLFPWTPFFLQPPKEQGNGPLQFSVPTITVALLCCHHDTQNTHKKVVQNFSRTMQVKRTVLHLCFALRCPLPHLFLASPLSWLASPALMQDNKTVLRSSKGSLCQNTALRSCRHCARAVPDI